MFFQRKPGRILPRVIVYTFVSGKQTPLPRKLTRHLDGRMDWEIDDWMRWYAAVHSLPIRRQKADLGHLEAILHNYLKHIASKNLNKITVRLHHDNLRIALPMFAAYDNFDQWFQVSGKLYQYLLDLKINPKRHNNINRSFKAFYLWLQHRDVVKHRHGLLLENRTLDEQNTPLRFTLTPDEVLAWVASQSVPELRFMALAGYFFSLRPTEVFGCRKQDLIAGTRATIFEDSKVLQKYKLYHKLVVNVRNCRRANGEFFKPSKRKKGGIVGCFDKRAAILIIEIVNMCPKEHIVDRFLPDYWVKRWAKDGIQGITPKDLRRASLYWLGHYTDMPFVGLKNHARHSDPKTTGLYVRRPEEAFEDNLETLLDLDA